MLYVDSCSRFLHVFLIKHTIQFRVVAKDFDFPLSGGMLWDKVKLFQKFLIYLSAMIRTKLWSSKYLNYVTETV